MPTVLTPSQDLARQVDEATGSTGPGRWLTRGRLPFLLYFATLGADSRVEVARMVERADRLSSSTT